MARVDSWRIDPYNSKSAPVNVSSERLVPARIVRGDRRGDALNIAAAITGALMAS